MSNGRKFDEELTTSSPDVRDRPPHRLGFGAFVADLETGRLDRGGPCGSPAPSLFETLCYLAQRTGRVISKTELVQRLWPDTFVTEDVLVQCIMEIRRALGDLVRSPHYVQTFPRRGYQFMAPVHFLNGTEAAPAAPWPSPFPAPLGLWGRGHPPLRGRGGGRVAHGTSRAARGRLAGPEHTCLPPARLAAGHAGQRRRPSG